jgi:hypothetical protein
MKISIFQAVSVLLIFAIELLAVDRSLAYIPEPPDRQFSIENPTHSPAEAIKLVGEILSTNGMRLESWSPELDKNGFLPVPDAHVVETFISAGYVSKNGENVSVVANSCRLLINITVSKKRRSTSTTQKTKRIETLLIDGLGKFSKVPLQVSDTPGALTNSSCATH